MIRKVSFAVAMAVTALALIRLGATMSGNDYAFLPMPRWASAATALLVVGLALATVVQISRDKVLSERAIRLGLVTQCALVLMLLSLGTR